MWRYGFVLVVRVTGASPVTSDSRTLRRRASAGVHGSDGDVPRQVESCVLEGAVEVSCAAVDRQERGGD